MKMRSQSLSVAESAGNELPVCAIRTISAVCLRYVDLRDMFGPVIKDICASASTPALCRWRRKRCPQPSFEHGMTACFDFQLRESTIDGRVVKDFGHSARDAVASR